MYTYIYIYIYLQVRVLNSCTRPHKPNIPLAGAILLIIPEFALETRPQLVGFVVSSCTIGAMVGTLVAAPFADAFGRRPPLIAAGLLFLIGGAAMGWSPRIEVWWACVCVCMCGCLCGFGVCVFVCMCV